MIVVAAVIVLSAIAMPALSNTVIERNINSAGIQLEQQIRLVQQKSITQRVGYPTFYIDFSAGAGGTYTVHIGTKAVTARLSSSLVMSLVGFSSPLSFDSMGRPSQGSAPSALVNDCSVLIGNAAATTATKQVSVSVGAVMGRVSVVWTRR